MAILRTGPRSATSLPRLDTRCPTSENRSTANWFVALAGLLPWWLLVLRTRIEEQKLIERFGDEYRRYNGAVLAEDPAVTTAVDEIADFA